MTITLASGAVDSIQIPKASPMSRSSFTRQVVDETGPEAAHTLSAITVAEYIHDISGQLGAMAGQAQLPMLHYLLTMVRLETEALIRTRAPGPKGGRRPQARSN